MIPYARQNITKNDLSAVKKVLRSNFLTQGPTVPKFENIVAKKVNSKFALAVNSATSALHLACLALGIGPQDLVWTSPNSFVASANCAAYCGAKLDFVDIDFKTYNISINELRKKLEIAKKKNSLPKVVIPVHFSGQPCEMFEIYKLAKKYNFKIIEDASHAIGSSYKLNKKTESIKVGSCKHSDITVFSFHPVKIITTGEGGMILTNKKKLYQKIKLLRSHGIKRSSEKLNHKNYRPWYYEQVDLGFNYRMNDIEAALGCEQIKRIKQFIKKRNQIAKYYNKAFKGLALNIPFQLPETYSSFHLYVITLKDNCSKKKHLEIFQKMRKSGIEVNLHYIPIHTQPYYARMGFKKGDYPVAENYYKRAISLPMYPSLKKKEQDYVIKILKKYLK